LTKHISDKDKKDWAEFIDSKEKLPNKDKENNLIKNVKIRSLDLHGCNLNDANKITEDFINLAFEDNINKLIVITGKGLHSVNEKDPYVSKDLGILKYSVPEFILNNKNLMHKISEIKDAKIEDGGSGAFYIYLKKKKSFV
tara:strand:- start:774 stop:1196 length:423 start_codon:yes stop_codon:yes gene_type:complete